MICHVGRGDGKRNDFGETVEDSGYRLTPKLQAKFAKLFEQKAEQPQ